MEFFRPCLKNALKFNWPFGLFLILILGIPRFLTVLHANQTADYRFTSIIFVVMWFLPFILLNKAGRREIGIKKPSSSKGIFIGILAGIFFCSIVWVLGDMLYGNTISNWLFYISKSYNITNPDVISQQRLTYFLIFGLTSMFFSPIGEELMYRGLIHRCFSGQIGENRASYVDSSAFALTHLAHFGIVYSNGSWTLLIFPAMLWVLLMFFASRIFFWVKQRSGTIYGAILSHAFFNLTMTYFILYHII